MLKNVILCSLHIIFRRALLSSLVRKNTYLHEKSNRKEWVNAAMRMQSGPVPVLAKLRNAKKTFINIDIVGLNALMSDLNCIKGTSTLLICH